MSIAFNSHGQLTPMAAYECCGELVGDSWLGVRAPSFP